MDWKFEICPNLTFLTYVFWSNCEMLACVVVEFQLEKFDLYLTSNEAGKAVYLI